MKFNETFKIIWWIVLTLITGGLFIWRMGAIGNGNSAPVDIFIFLIFVALLLVPIFSEIEFFGIKLKGQIEKLKTEMEYQFRDIKNDIRINQSQTIHQNITGFGPPPPDDKLPELDTQIDRILKEKLKNYGIDSNVELSDRLEVPDDNLFLFQVRYNIEQQIRRIWENRMHLFESENSQVKHFPLTKIIRELMKFQIIDSELNNILREMLSICNYAIHGEKVSKNQIDFVNRNSDEIINFLKRLK